MVITFNDLSGVIESAKAVKDTAKSLPSLVKGKASGELVPKMMELLEQTQELVEELVAIQSKIRLMKGMVFRDKAYYLDDEPDAYCAHCFETDGVLVHLQGKKKDYYCYACQHHFH